MSRVSMLAWWSRVDKWPNARGARGRATLTDHQGFSVRQAQAVLVCCYTSMAAAGAVLPAGVSILSKNHPVNCADSSEQPRDGLTLEQAIAWCRSMPDCAGMWFYDNGRTCPKAHWDPSPANFSRSIAAGTFYQVRFSFPRDSPQ